jgi:hypothetical protein
MLNEIQHSALNIQHYLFYQVSQSSGKLIARDNLGHSQRSGPVKRVDFFMIGKGEDGNGLQSCIGFEGF